jgi:hypothetical protein
MLVSTLDKTSKLRNYPMPQSLNRIAQSLNR